ncbi:MAG: class I SAM-dependent methyltransferase [Pseudomonadota bacterium]
MTIAEHSKLAKFYAGRPPYVPRFFKTAAQKLSLSHDSALLDLCCGRGELSTGFASHCRTIYAVDGSQQMLEHSIAGPNITYLLRDVNNEAVTLPGPVDHIVIGSAIHWIEPRSLAALIGLNLKDGGKVLVSHTLMKLESQPWFAALASLNADYGKSGEKNFKDLEGADRLQSCGFNRIDGIREVRQARFSVEQLYRSQLSYLYSEFYRQVSDDLQGYRTRLAELVTPHLDADGKLSGTLVNWGVIYGRQ